MCNDQYNYAAAPYNFIPFQEKVVYRHEFIEVNGEVKICSESNEKEVVFHNKFRKDLKTGYVKYRIKVETPLFIGDGKEEFFKVNGEYVIPGSTIRGKIRSTAEILSCSYPEFIDDAKLWYRGTFSDNVLKNMYKNFLLPNENSKINDKVKAGYLIKQKNNYKIIPAKELNDKCFAIVHESILRNQQFKIKDGLANTIFMYDLNDSKTKKPLWELFYKLKEEKKNVNTKINDLPEEETEIKKGLVYEKSKIQGEIIDLLKRNSLDSFDPYYCNILYDNGIKDIRRYSSKEEYGFLMNSNKICNGNKQNHYIIYQRDSDAKTKVINNKIINQFNTSVEYRQRKIANKFHLPNESETKPVFYILDENKEVAAFGFTPYLKIPYEKSICEGIKTIEETDKPKLDYAQSIFGFTNFKYKKDGKEKNCAYKGRVSFANAKIVVSKGFEETVHKSLMSPKLSSFQLYLNQPQTDKMNLKTYAGDFELRGQKFYWLKNKYDGNDDFVNQSCKGKPLPEKQFAKLTPISEGSCFEGKIYFENLHEDELGLLLMAIKPFENAKDNLGQGKPYGFGKVEFNILGIEEIDSESRFKMLNLEKNDISNLQDKIKNYHEKFITYMMTQDVEVNFNEGRLKSFSISRLKEEDLKNPEFKYMRFKDNKFTNRNILKPMEHYATENQYKNYEKSQNAFINKSANIKDNSKNSSSKVASDKYVAEDDNNGKLT
ncbi:TIGR03986 family CRISPR-associated RAMP protein [Clostridium sp. FP1]|uniref:TIGR03986 family type III CRISPR-associated RAMP protein n=1 Tax=Clostridium sp. FP1 TaxID=2724076 RepID=UPI0013E92B65|nr:TIGR03986 family CRISPR-associated RAMP protein [Clostridium sp. FP1]MBZ9634066.1 TIGR03986 family CRISPR-associated RAMP protein [Clostridium sp. FP1]